MAAPQAALILPPHRLEVVATAAAEVVAAIMLLADAQLEQAVQVGPTVVMVAAGAQMAQAELVAATAAVEHILETHQMVAMADRLL